MTYLPETSRREYGAISFATCILVPLIFAFGAVATDFAAWTALSDKVQSEADQLALAAARQLPDYHAAKSVAELSSRSRVSGMVVSVDFPTASSARVMASVQYLPTLTRLFSAEYGFKVNRQSVARIAPSDTVLVVADGPTLRPALRTDGGVSFDEPWGPELDWPAAKYIECAKEPVEADWLGMWNRPNFGRWLTQACFNPMLSSVKLAAANLAKGLLWSDANRLAVIFTPGQDSPAGELIRSLGSGDASTPGGFGGDGRQLARLHAGSERGAFTLSAADCMALSLFDISLSGRYAPPTLTTDTCAANIVEWPCGRPYRRQLRSDSCAAPGGWSDIANAILWHPAVLADAPSQGGLLAAIGTAIQELEKGMHADIPEQLAARLQLAADPLRRIVVLTDSLRPLREQPLRTRQLLGQLHDLRTELWVLSVANPYTSRQTGQLWSEAEEVRREFRSSDGLHVIGPATTDQLVREVTSTALRQISKVVLAR